MKWLVFPGYFVCRANSCYAHIRLRKIPSQIMIFKKKAASAQYFFIFDKKLKKKKSKNISSKTLCSDASSVKKLFDHFHCAFEILEFQNLYYYVKSVRFLETRILQLKTMRSLWICRILKTCQTGL